MGKKQPTKNPGRQSGKLVPFSADVEPRFIEGLNESARREDRKKRAIVQRALEAYFIATGIWPKPDP